MALTLARQPEAAPAYITSGVPASSSARSSDGGWTTIPKCSLSPAARPSPRKRAI